MSNYLTVLDCDFVHQPYIIHSFIHERTIFSECWSSQQVLQDLAILLEWTLHLLPGHELTHLFGEFPEFLKQNHKQTIQVNIQEEYRRNTVLHCTVIHNEPDDNIFITVTLPLSEVIWPCRAPLKLPSEQYPQYYTVVTVSCSSVNVCKCTVLKS